MQGTPGKRYLIQWRKSRISLDSTLQHAMEAISRTGSFMACILDKDGVLKGIVGDGDLRRALLKGAQLGDPAIDWAQTSPVVARRGLNHDGLKQLAREFGVREIPIVDGEGKLTDIYVSVLYENASVDDSCALHVRTHEFPMMILAGGLGTRLRSVVSDRPKPLAVVGKRTILETLISHARQCGFLQFNVAVNYMADMIIEHLQTEIYAPLDIRIFKETRRLGTAGPLGYLQGKVTKDIVVVNADVLTKVPFDKLMTYHKDSKADITCVVRPYSVEVPYGVVKLLGESVYAIEEKPSFSYLVNSGIYAIKPELLDQIQPDIFLDMPDFIAGQIANGKKVVPFFTHEYWIDIGRPADFEKANSDYDHVFSNSQVNL